MILFCQEVDESDDDEIKQESWDNWNSHSTDVRDTLQMAPDLTPWTPTAKLDGVPGGLRFTDAIQIAYYAWLKTVKTAKVPKSPAWCIDISQGIERRPWSVTPRTLAKGSLCYVFALDRVLDGEDHLFSSCAHCCDMSIHQNRVLGEELVHLCFSDKAPGRNLL